MKRLLFTGLLSAVFINVINAQSLPSLIFSPLQKNEILVPYAESDFLSIRMQGLGYQLFNVVEDEVTDLFRNPVSLYNLQKNLLLINFEEPYAYYPPIQPLAVGVSNVSSSPPIIIYEPFSNRGIFRSTGFNLLRIPSDNPYLSAGYWSPQLGFLKTPVGIFVRGTLSEERFQEPSAYQNYSLPGQDYFYARKDEQKMKELFAQFWIGLLNGGNFKLGFSYNFFYYTSSVVNDRFNYQSAMYSPDQIRIVEDKQNSGGSFDWKRHRFSLGARWNPGKWKIEPGISLFLYSNEAGLADRINREDIQYVSSFPDSILNYQRNDMRREASFKQDLTGVEFDLQARKGKTTLFVTGFYCSVSPAESGLVESGALQTYYQDTTRFEAYNSQFNFDDRGSLWRVRGGIGRTYKFKKPLKLYTSAIAEYERYELSGLLPGSGSSVELGQEPADTTIQYSLDYRSNQLRLLLPIGFEATYRMLSVRFGVVWYYWQYKHTPQLTDQFGDLPYVGEIYEQHTYREEFFGMGFNWKRMELNIAAFNDVWQFRNWNVGFRYRF